MLQSNSLKSCAFTKGVWVQLLIRELRSCTHWCGPQNKKKLKKKKKRSLHLPVNIDVILTTTGMRNSRDKSLSGECILPVYMCVEGKGGSEVHGEEATTSFPVI